MIKCKNVYLCNLYDVVEKVYYVILILNTFVSGLQSPDPSQGHCQNLHNDIQDWEGLAKKEMIEEIEEEDLKEEDLAPSEIIQENVPEMLVLVETEFLGWTEIDPEKIEISNMIEIKEKKKGRGKEKN